MIQQCLQTRIAPASEIAAIENKLRSIYKTAAIQGRRFALPLAISRQGKTVFPADVIPIIHMEGERGEIETFAFQAA